METSAKKLPSAWTSPLLMDKPLINQEAAVSVALSIEKSNTAQILSKTKKPNVQRYPQRCRRMLELSRRRVLRVSELLWKDLRSLRTLIRV